MFESDDMLRLFYQDWGVEIAFTPTDGTDPFTVIGIFDARPVGDRQLKGAQPRHSEGAMITGNAPQARCLTSDIDGKVKAGRCTATVGGRTFNVFDARPDGLGESHLTLKVA